MKRRHVFWASETQEHERRDKKNTLLSEEDKKNSAYLDFNVEVKFWHRVKYIFSNLEKEKKLGLFLNYIEYKPFKHALEQVDNECFENLVSALPKRHQTLLAVINNHELVRYFIESIIRHLEKNNLHITIGNILHCTGPVASISKIFGMFINISLPLKDIIQDIVSDKFLTKEEAWRGILNSALRHAVSASTDINQADALIPVLKK